MSIHQHRTIGDTVYFWFGSNDTSGSGDDGAAAAADVRLAGAGAAVAPVLSPAPTLLTHVNYPDGCYEVAVAATVGNGFAAGSTYAVFCTLTVDAQNPTGFVGSFSLEPIISNVQEISDDSAAAVNLETACDNYSATRGLAGTALPAAAADAAGGLPVSDAGGLDLDTALEEGMFAFGMVWVDDAGTASTAWPYGAAPFPTDTIARGKTIADANSLNSIRVKGNHTLAAAMEDYNFYGGLLIDTTEIITLGGFSTEHSSFERLVITGASGNAALINDATTWIDCYLFAVTNINGWAYNGRVEGACSIRDGGYATLHNVLFGSGLACTLTLQAPTVCDIENMAGELTLAGMDGGVCSVSMSRGAILTIDNTCVAGTITVTGAGTVTDNSGGGCAVTVQVAEADVVQISGDSVAADNLEAACDGGSYNVGGGAVVAASVTGAVGSVTGNVGGNVTGSVGSVTGNVGGNVVGTVASVVGAVGSVTGNVGGNVTGSAGSVIGNIGGNVVGNVNGTVASVVGNLGGNVVGNVNGNVVGSVGSVIGAVGSVTGAVGSVTGNVGGNVTGTVASVVGNVGGNLVGNVNGNVVGSVGSVLGNVAGTVASIVGNVGGNVLGSVASIAAGGVAAASFAANAITAAALATDAAQEIADTTLGRNLGAVAGAAARSLLEAVRFLRNRWAIAAGTLTVYEEDDVTPAWTATVSTAVSDPVDEIDPA
jgi:hypothetical protein